MPFHYLKYESDSFEMVQQTYATIIRIVWYSKLVRLALKSRQCVITTSWSFGKTKTIYICKKSKSKFTPRLLFSFPFIENLKRPKHDKSFCRAEGVLRVFSFEIRSAFGCPQGLQLSSSKKQTSEHIGQSRRLGKQKIQPPPLSVIRLLLLRAFN